MRRAERVVLALAAAGETGQAAALAQRANTIAPPVGAMSAYLSRLMSSRSFLSLRELGSKMAKRFPRGIERTLGRAEEYALLCLSIIENPMLNGSVIRLDAGTRMPPK